MSIEVRMLGPFEMSSLGTPVELPGNRLRTLVAVLAMSAGRSVSIDTIGEALSGSKPPANLHATVYTYVARLRQLLGEEVIATGEGMYRLDIPPDSVDALRLQRLSDEGDVSALALWRGQPFLTLRSDWLESHHAARLTECYLGLLERRIDRDLADGRVADLVAGLSALVEQHPLRESLWARLLIVLDRSGRPAEALERYETIRRRLATELAIDPGPELRQVYADLLAADAISSQAFDVPRQLPSDIEQFTGRADILAKLDRLIPTNNDATRPIVIAAVHGAAGIGKTALAVHWAHRVRNRFPDGQLFVNLRGYSPGQPVAPAAALDSLLRSIGVPGEQIPDGVSARQSLLRRLLAGRRTLLVLDNARDADHVRPLLPGSTCQVVVTSRNQLHDLAVNEQASRITLDQLTPDESVALLGKALRIEPPAYDDSDLAELAELCGNLPLALAIAAEHANREGSGRLPELVRELRDRQTRLTTLDIDDLATSPRAVFSWSYQALDPETARCFRLLSLHPGPDFGSRSVAVLVGTPPKQAVRLLDQLTDGHLVHQTGRDRYEQHDLVRAYAAELCREHDRPSEQDACLGRLYDWYLHSTANARRAIGSAPLPITIGKPEPDVATFDDSKGALEWLDRERQNLVATVQQAADRGQHRAAYQVTLTLNSYLTHRYLLDDVVAVQSIAMHSAELAGDMAAMATSANQLAMTLNRREQQTKAIDYLEAALRWYREDGNELGEAAALTNLGFVLSDVGRAVEAISHYQQASIITHRMGRLDGEAVIHNNLGMAYVDLGQYTEAEASCRRAIEIHRGRGDLLALARVCDSLGQALAGQGRYREAVDEYRTALEIHIESGNRWQQAATLAHLGSAERASGRPDAARTSWQRALDLCDEFGITDTAELRRADLVDLLASIC